jgi:quinohemoprotein ethanol dehydrogenase
MIAARCLPDFGRVLPASPRASRQLIACALCLVLLCAAAASAQPPPKPATPRGVDAARIRGADTEPGNWLSHGRTYDEQRYSPLVSLTRENVTDLGLAWSYEIGSRRGLEATPLVADGVLYATGTWSVVFAIDAASGRELWRFDPEVPRWKGRYACCDVVNRGIALWGDKVYVGTIDGRLIALDARSGKKVWDVVTVDPERPYTITGAPRVVKGRVVIGNGGADLGVRGYFGAYDAETGELLWRFYTVPASHAGPHEHPALEIAARSWSARSLFETGLGGTVWDAFAYDPELDLLYVGVGNSSVYERALRSPGGGDNLYLASILAVRPDTGALVWHYQTTPGESWDYTATQHMILADLELADGPRKVLMQAPKNGFFYVLDRATGELLSADAYVPVSWATHVDLETGRPVERPEASWTSERAYVTPGPMGGHSWHPMSYSPRTGLVYIPSLSSTYAYQPDPSYRYEPRAWNTAEDLGSVTEDLANLNSAMPFCNPSHITAWDPVRKRQRWRVDSDHAVPGGLLTTASDLLFQGSGDGRIRAFDARSGELLWSDEVGIGIMAPPITYRVAGVQYVAVLAGVGGSHGGHYTQIDYVNEGRLLAWKLGGKAKMPPLRARPEPTVDVPRIETTPEEIELGQNLYARYCISCHGMGAESSGLHPDLRHSTRSVHEEWNSIVRGGTRQGEGMASFADHLSASDARAIHAYVIQRALREPGLSERALRWLGGYVCMPATWLAD